MGFALSGREAMVRVHEGLPARALPMDVPRRSSTVVQTDNGWPNRRSKPRKKQEQDPVERVLIDVLRGIFR